MASKVLPTEKIGDDLPCLLWQRKRIISNCKYKDDIKEEWVQAATGDVKRTSLKSITQKQARWIIMAQEGSTQVNQNAKNSPSGEASWGAFELKNPKHKVIMSLLHQLQWTVPNAKHGEVADMKGAFSNWLKSNLSPVRKPLLQMNGIETEKIIKALENITISKFDKP